MAVLKKEQLAGMGMHYKYRTFDYFLQSQKELGISNIEVWGARPHFLMDDYGYEDVEAFRTKIEGYGLKISAFSPECTIYNYNLCAHDECAARHSMGYFINGIQAAAKMAAPIMIINGCGGARNEESERIFDRAVRRLSILAHIAEECGIIVAVETVRTDDSAVFNHLSELELLLKAVSHKNIQASLDLTAAGMAGENMKEWFDTFGEKVKHIHFVDGRPHGKLIWGEGLRPLEDQLKWIEQYNYKGYLSLALNDAKYLEDPRSADNKNMAALSEYIR